MSAARKASRACTFTITTPLSAGAIGCIHLDGDVLPILRAITGRESWPIGRPILASLDGIDEGIVCRIAEETAFIMPHGGVRIMQRLSESLRTAGAAPCASNELDPEHLYPEAVDRYEAIMLRALPRLQSELGLELLLDQPGRWRVASSVSDEDRARSARLNRLFEPPLVVVAGPANVGKSTLSNRLLGRAMSIEHDMPGTTRDYVAARINLRGLVVNWIDSPGLRDESDAIEKEAIELARQLMERADLLIALSDHEHDWPHLPREPDLRVRNKCDVAQRDDDCDLSISATTGKGIDMFVSAVREVLLPEDDLAHPGVWMFDDALASSPSPPTPTPSPSGREPG